jgi:hypothetical protein
VVKHVWAMESLARAEREGDAARLRLGELYREGLALHGQDPKRALALYEQGRALADRLGESRWALLFDHWRLQVLNWDGDAAAALDVAVRATVEARKPLYDDHPSRVCVHEDLIGAYLLIDPRGYADAIRDALGYMESAVDPQSECLMCLRGLEADFALNTGDPAGARGAALRAAETAQRHPDAGAAAHHLLYVSARLCAAAHAEDDPRALLRWASAGEELVPSTRRQGVHAELLAWKALALLRTGDRAAARRQLLRAAARAAERAGPAPRGYFEAVCAFEEHDDNLVGALKARGKELAGLAGRGRLLDECRCRVERSRLLARLGYPLAAELADARAAANRLRDPAPHLRVLDAIEADAAGLST